MLHELVPGTLQHEDDKERQLLAFHDLIGAHGGMEFALFGCQVSHFAITQPGFQYLVDRVFLTEQ